MRQIKKFKPGRYLIIFEDTDLSYIRIDSDHVFYEEFKTAESFLKFIYSFVFPGLDEKFFGEVKESLTELRSSTNVISVTAFHIENDKVTQLI